MRLKEMTKGRGPDSCIDAVGAEAHNGIAFDAAKDIVYFSPLTAHALYKITASDLRAESLSEESIGQKVQKLADTHIPDGMLERPDGSIILTNVEEDAVIALTGHGGGQPGTRDEIVWIENSHKLRDRPIQVNRPVYLLVTRDVRHEMVLGVSFHP